jgi:hypothetical protein
VAGEHDRAARRGPLAEQAAQPRHAAGIEAVGGLVEDQHVGSPSSAPATARPLPHAERVPADPAAGGVGQVHGLEHVRHPLLRGAGRAGEDPQVVAAPAAGVDGGVLEDGADHAARPRQLGVRPAADQGPPRGRAREAEEEPERRRLAGPVGAEERRHAARPQLEGQVVDGGQRAVALGQAVHGHVGHGFPPGSSVRL